MPNISKKNIFEPNNRKLIILVSIIILILGFFYLSCLPVITPDSTEYYRISHVIRGNLPFSEWWELRGPTFPIVIVLMVSIFGDSPVGFLVGTFVFFAITLLVLFFVVKKLISLINDRLAKLITVFLVVMLVVFNPITIGYYHAMLTEFVGVFIALAATCLSISWASYRPSKRSVTRLILMPALFSLCFVAAWLLKQPYLTLAAVPMLLATIISIFRVGGYKNNIYKTASFILCCIVLVIVANYWSGFLCSKRECLKASSPNSYFSSGLVKGASAFWLTDYSHVTIAYSDKINERAQPGNIESAIVNGNIEYERYDFYTVHDRNNKEFDYIIIDRNKNREDVGVLDSASTLFNFAIKHPVTLARSYVYNYLSLIDFMSFQITEKGQWVPLARNIFKTGGENYNLSYSVFVDRNIYWWQKGDRPEVADVLDSYEVYRDNNIVVETAFGLIGGPHQMLFVMTFLMLPIVFIISIARFIKSLRNKINKNNKHIQLNDMVLLLSGVSFIHALTNVFTGAIIDRYISVVYPLALLALIVFVVSYIKKKKGVDAVYSQNNDKLLFVVPAYNESANIGGVINDIRDNLPDADIVVVNDCSKDNTKEIAESMGVVCLDMPFNVRYAMAVQAGIKYAKDKNYGYVIQFDADGQHLANEAKKLYEEIKSSNVDIVIGSRFAKKTDYKHPLARVIGTKLNSMIVELFCGKKITDPTSGLQCLNRRVIEKYSQIGGYPEYPDANLLVEMLLAGYQVNEVPVVMKLRENGEGMHSGVIKPIKYTVKVTYSIFINVLKSLEIRRRE